MLNGKWKIAANALAHHILHLPSYILHKWTLEKN